MEQLVQTLTTVSLSTGELRWLATLGGGEPSSEPFTGVKALMLAVLREGIRSYLDDNWRVRQEAERWINNTKGRSVFSFNVVCETLGFEPSAISIGIRKLRAREIPPEFIGRARPRFSRKGLGRHQIGSRSGRNAEGSGTRAA
jgi:hypothetical protein